MFPFFNTGSIFGGTVKHLNVEIGDHIRIDDVCEKIGRVFGEDAAEAGRLLDNVTKNITIRIESPEQTH